MGRAQTLVRRPIEVSNRYHLFACDPTDHQASSRDANGGASGASTTAPALLSDHQQGRQFEENAANINKFPEKRPEKFDSKIGNWRPTTQPSRMTARKLEVPDNKKT